MAEGLGPSPEEMGVDTSGRIENPELAQEMAKAEIGPRDKLEVAKQLGLSEQALKALGGEIDQASEVKRAEYERAMQQADQDLLDLIKKGNVFDSVQFPKSEHARIEALKYRTTELDEHGNLVPKTIKMSWGSAKISIETDRAGSNAVLRFR